MTSEITIQQHKEWPVYAKIEENTKGAHVSCSIQGDDTEAVHNSVMALYVKLKESLKNYENTERIGV